MKPTAVTGSLLGSFCWTDLRYCQQFKKSDFLELSYKGQVTSAKTLRKGTRSCLVVKYDLLCCFDVFPPLTLFKTQQTHASGFKLLKTHQVQQKLNFCRRIKLLGVKMISIQQATFRWQRKESEFLYYRNPSNKLTS